MVTARLEQASAYFNLSEGIRTALEYLRREDLAALPAGRHEIEGDQVFALVSDYDTRATADAFWEAHRRHVDVQYVHAGAERIGWGDLAAFDIRSYDAAADLVVADGTSGRFVDVEAGRFVILFPHDVHMPGITGEAVSRVRKVVVKVRV
jgi:YhcH/YjgK/YiaL family protein